jgi:hypothetical protein
VVTGGGSAGALFIEAEAVVGTTNVGPASLTNALLVTNGGGFWSANAMGGSGTVTIAALTSTSASGSFSFTLVPSGMPDNIATGTRTVTNGRFNVTF